MFTTAKSFKSNPIIIIGNKFLNIIECHVTRLITSHTIYEMQTDIFIMLQIHHKKADHLVSIVEFRLKYLSVINKIPS